MFRERCSFVIITSVQFGTFVERSNNVVSERLLWLVIERPRERCGNVALHVFCNIPTTFIDNVLCKLMF